MGRYPLSLLHKAFIALAVILIPIFVTFVAGYRDNKMHIEDDLLNELTSTADAYEGLVYQSLDKAAQRALDFSSDGAIADSLLGMAQGDVSMVKSLGGYLRAQKLPLDRTITRISVISPDGAVIASTDAAETGKDVSGAAFFVKSRSSSSPVVAEYADPKAPFIVASAPVYAGKERAVIGIVADYIRVSELNRTINDVLTGEYNRLHGVIPWPGKRHIGRRVYVVDKDKRLIVKPAFMKEAEFGSVVDVLPVRMCLEEKREFSGFYEDFRKIKVAGSSMCLPGLDWVLLAEADAVEALQPLAEMQRGAVAGGVVAAGLVVLVFTVFFRGITMRLRRLSDSANDIAMGNYDVVVPAGPGDEIGMLSDSFNRMALDIKYRTRMLQESEERTSAIIDNSTAVIYLKDKEGRYMLANRSFEKVSGLGREGIIGKTDFDIFPDDEAAAFRANDMKVLDEKRPFEFEEILSQAGVRRHVISVKVPILSTSGIPFALCGISTDITERKLAEERIERLKRLYSVLSRLNEAIVRVRDIENLYEEACCIAVKEGGFLLAWVGLIDPETSSIRAVAHCGNDKSYLEKLWGPAEWHTPEGGEPAVKAIFDGAHLICNNIGEEGGAPPWMSAALESGFRSEAAFPLYRGKKPVGAISLYSGEAGFFNDDEVRLLDTLAADISFAIESIEFEKQARQTEEEMHMLQTISLAVSEAEDFRAALKIAVGKVCNITGWSFGEVWAPNFDGSALEYYSAWHGDKEGYKRFAELSGGAVFTPGRGLPGRVWKRGKPEWVMDVSVNGETFVRAGAALDAGLKAGFGVPIAAGEDVAAVMVFFMKEPKEEDRHLIDLVSTVAMQLGAVIKRKLAEDETAELKKRYEELVNNITVGIYRATGGEKGRFIEANRALVEMLGAPSKEELLAKDPAAFYHDRERQGEMMRKLMKEGFIKDEEAGLVTLNGKKLWVSTSAVMKKDKDGSTYCDGIIEDITERKRLEEQLIHSQRMEAVGQLAGGIAHDFNNILTAIIGYANLLNMKAPCDETSKNYADHILSLSGKAAALVSGLLAFGRKQPVRLQAIDLNEIIRRAGKILSRVIGEHIAFKTSFSKKELTVMADPVQIEQVLMNLSTNARDAMSGGGTLSISTGLAEPDGEFLMSRGAESPGRYALLTFADTGAGMDEGTKRKIFEPFFTTKEQGKGTGLGLSMVYGIIKQHGGLIDVWSEPGRGSAFMIYLPLAASAAMEAEKEEVPLLEGGTETVLLAEDEEEVRKIAKTMLEEFGYRVIDASDGEDAVNKFMENKDSVALLILDVVMPKKGGRRAYEEIKRIRPDIKAIFISGHEPEKAYIGKAADFIMKPVSPTELLKKIREVIER